MNYILVGNQSIFLEKRMNEIIDSLVTDRDDFNVSFLDVDSLGIDDIVTELNTYPFGSENKVVILKNPYFMMDRKVKNDLNNDTSLLINYLKNPVSFSTLIIIINPKMDERKEIVKNIKKLMKVENIEGPDKKQATEYIRKMFVSANVKIDNDALQEFISRVPDDYTLIANEIKKLKSYSDRLTKEDIINLTPAKLEENVFELTDGIIANNKNKALKVFKDLRMNNVDPVTMISLVAGQLRFMYQVCYLKDEGYGAQTIASKLGVHPYRVEISLRKAYNYNPNQLLKSLTDLADLDISIKSGLVDKDNGFELFILKLGVNYD
ncbi:MAG: DNA polymerase III subunit delta [Erysipelotrichaceae bacterium]|nr:DNA polymerase III subunit delta [Erysipelotrichaceae bacterium]